MKIPVQIIRAHSTPDLVITMMINKIRSPHHECLSLYLTASFSQTMPGTSLRKVKMKTKSSGSMNLVIMMTINVNGNILWQ